MSIIKKPKNIVNTITILKTFALHMGQSVQEWTK